MNIDTSTLEFKALHGSPGTTLYSQSCTAVDGTNKVHFQLLQHSNDVVSAVKDLESTLARFAPLREVLDATASKTINGGISSALFDGAAVEIALADASFEPLSPSSAFSCNYECYVQGVYRGSCTIDFDWSCQIKNLDWQTAGEQADE